MRPETPSQEDPVRLAPIIPIRPYLSGHLGIRQFVLRTATAGRPESRAAVTVQGGSRHHRFHVSVNRSSQSFDGSFLAFMVVVAVVGGEGLVTDLAAQLASLTFGGHHPVPGGVGSGVTAFLHLWHHLDNPRLAWSPNARILLPGPAAMWLVLSSTELVFIALAVAAIRSIRRHRPAGSDPGQAGRAEVERHMGRKVVAQHTTALYGRRVAARREPLALGQDAATGTRLFAKSEDYILAIGTPRVGKGEGFVIPAVLRHRGPAVVTATRHDTYMDTAAARMDQGPVFVFDPQMLVPKATKLRWNPVKGCEVPQKAILRARGFAGFAGVGPAVDGGGAYWEQVAASIIRSYLHAAALEHLGVAQLLAWSRRPAAREPVRILSRHPMPPLGGTRTWPPPPR